jgi:hypothetical protein
VPLVAAYAIATRPPRKLRRLYDRREELMQRLRDEYQKTK